VEGFESNEPKFGCPQVVENTQNRQTGGDQSRKLRCYNCGEEGHIRPSCLNPKKESPPQTEELGSDSDEDRQANFATWGSMKKFKHIVRKYYSE